jgi:eukaryotic-like serine/threonine-protein kinase
MAEVMIGRTLSRYRVLEQIGAGGMGVVYRAHDERLDRDVALKVLADGLLGDETARRRFELEARMLSRLSHPHIGLVLDFDHHDGVDYLVMELVPGRTLAERLQAGPLAEEEVLELGSQIAAALAAAHEQGVIHRDLKPTNIKVTPRGEVKVLDFGLARLARPEEAPAVALTQTRVVLGTLPYSAPEQLLGSAADHRADQFAFGAVLYEMATARPPFVEPVATALVHAIVNLAPVAPRSLNPDLSSGLESVILRCLEKDPGRRFASAAAVGAALDLLARARGSRSGAARAAGIASIAVLPLENLSHDPAQEYFADGMTEALIAELARNRSLRVVSRTSALRFKGVTRPLPDIARELGADAVIEGSVLRAGNRVRITARLIEAVSERPLWSESYDRSMRDVLSIQGEVAEQVAGAVQANLGNDETPATPVRAPEPAAPRTPSVRPRRRTRARGARKRSVNPDAFEAYLKGRFWWNRRDEQSLRRGVEFFEKAIALDPGYGRAYAGLADCYNILADNNWEPPRSGFDRARAAALRALELDPELPEAHTSLAYIHIFFERDWAKAEQSFRTALEHGPEYPTAHQWYASLHATLGRFDEAVSKAVRSTELDPMAPILFASLGEILYYAHRFEESIQQTRRAFELDPGLYIVYTDLARSYEQWGRLEEAIAHYLKAAELSGRDARYSPGLACAYALAGRREEALAIRDALIERSRTGYVPNYAMASIAAMLDDREDAFAWLERALVGGDRAMVWLRVNPRFDRLHDDPRFADLVRRMGFPDAEIRPQSLGTMA